MIHDCSQNQDVVLGILWPTATYYLKVVFVTFTVSILVKKKRKFFLDVLHKHLSTESKALEQRVKKYSCVIKYFTKMMSENKTVYNRKNIVQLKPAKRIKY